MRLVSVVAVPVLLGAGITIAPNAPIASADCTTAGQTTICSQGDVRGSNSGGGPGSGPYVPYPCDINWYDCDNYWEWDIDLDADINPGPGGPDIGLPGRPGVGNPIAPGRPGGGGGRGGGRR